MSQGNARWGIGATGPVGPTGPIGPQGPAGTGQSGVALFQLSPVTPSVFLGRYATPSGIPQEMVGPTAVGLLPMFTALAGGLVPAPTGGVAGNFLRDDGTWQAAGAAGRPSGVTLGEQAFAGPFTLQGRNGGTTGIRQDLAPGAVASMLPAFTGSGARGVLQGPTGGSVGAFLRDDGQWQGVPTLGTPTLAAAGPTGAVQYNTGSGFGGSSGFSFDGLKLQNGLIGYTPTGIVFSGVPGAGNGAAIQLPYAAGGVFAVRGMTASGALAHILRDGTDTGQHEWGSTVTTEKQRYNTVASGQMRWFMGANEVMNLTSGQFRLNAGVQLGLANSAFSGATDKLGAVTPSGFANVATGIQIMASGMQLLVGPTGGNGPMLTASGLAFADIYGVGNAQMRLMPPSTIKANVGQTGAPQDMVGSGVATLLPVFNAIDKGLVPGGGGGSTSNFLRADGTWAAPSVGAGVSGVAFNQLQDVSPLTILGRLNGSGTIAQLSPLTVASMLPWYLGTGFGLVPIATGANGTQFLRDDGKWTTPSSGSNPTGVTNSQLANAPPLTIKGNNSATATGAVQDLTVGQVASLLGLVSVPSSTPQGLFLRDDGTFASPTGLTQAQQVNRPPFTFDGRFTLGTGVQESMSAGQAASLLPVFFGSGSRGVVIGPTGGAAGNFLRDDGSWQAAAGGSATGIANSALAAMPPFTFKARTTLGSGIPEDISIGQMASMLPRFLGSGAGLVPVPSAAGSGMFLRDDGKWSSPTGLGNGQFALMPPSTIKGTPGATGLPQDLVGSGVATLLPVFNNVDKGLVPAGAGGSTANFLRADGQWAAPSVGGGVSGIAFNQITDVSPFKFLGRPSVSSGTIQEISPLAAASMLPLFKGSGMGMVPNPTGGSSGFFLRDDGQWTPLLRNEVVGPQITGFMTLAASATIDFTTGEFQERDISGQVRFYLTPPSMMRHVQLRIKNTASGANPTFFGTAVRFAGGSGAAPSLFARASGGVSTANFFWDGSLFWGTAGNNFA